MLAIIWNNGNNDKIKFSVHSPFRSVVVTTALEKRNGMKRLDCGGPTLPEAPKCEDSLLLTLLYLCQWNIFVF